MRRDDAHLDRLRVDQSPLRVEFVIDEAGDGARSIAGIGVDREHPYGDGWIAEQQAQAFGKRLFVVLKPGQLVAQFKPRLALLVRQLPAVIRGELGDDVIGFALSQDDSAGWEVAEFVCKFAAGEGQVLA